MTTEEMRIAIAKSIGITVPGCVVKGGWLESSLQHATIPELTLDWMHEVEKTLNIDEFGSYTTNLLYVTTGQYVFRHAHDFISCISSKAEQRAEAYLRVKCLWKD